MILEWKCNYYKSDSKIIVLWFYVIASIHLQIADVHLMNSRCTTIVIYIASILCSNSYNLWSLLYHATVKICLKDKENE
jgi:hypothetical protein